MGCNSGAALNEGDHNVLLGCNSGCKLTSGCQNVFLGQDAGCNGTTVNNSVFIGNLAGKGQSTNGQNVAIGAEAMCCGGTGFHNVALGSGAGKCITSGSKNVAIGFKAMFSANVTGAYNVAFGHYASCKLTGGNNNVAVGTCAGRKNQTGSGNVNLGPNAGCNNTGSGNIMLGEDSGRNIGGHNSNIFIGKYAACAQSQGSNNIAIGCHVCLAICSGTGSSNQLAIGVGGDRWIAGNCDFNVGIGTADPSSRLSVAGDACVSGVITATSFVGDGSNLTGVGGTTNVSTIGLVVAGLSTFHNNVELLSMDDGSSAAPEFILNRHSASPADADYLGNIKFQGKQDGGGTVNYAKISGKILDASNGTEDGILEFMIRKNGSNNIAARFRSDSLQLLNDTAFSVAGDITANGNIAGDSSTNITGIADITASGTVQAGNFDSTSDVRLKTNIQPIDDPIAKVIQIEGVSFNWKKDNRPALGVIADQVQEILPELVHGDDPKTVNYNGLVGLLIEVVKDQQKQIDSLNDRISKLE